MIHAVNVKMIKIIGSILPKKYKTAKPFMILKSIKYDIGLKYPEYRPCLNKLKLCIYKFQKKLYALSLINLLYSIIL